MSWFTVGEIVVWMLLAALLGVGLGWLLRGLLTGRPPEPTAAAADVAYIDEGTRVGEFDTGEAGTAAEAVDLAGSAAVSAHDRASEIASRTAGGLTPPHDDLERIHGVGPKIAARLEAMGITSFRQVARMTEEEAAVVNEALDVFPGRIERDDWIGAARELHREVYGSDPAG